MTYINKQELEYDLTKTIYYKKSIPICKNNIYVIMEFLRDDAIYPEFSHLFENYYNKQQRKFTSHDIIKIMDPNDHRLRHISLKQKNRCYS